MPRDDSNRTIGKIVSVSADHLIVELHKGNDNFTVIGFDDIHYVATLGSYLLVPNQSSYVILEVVGLREKDFSPKFETSPELDKTSSAKFLDVIPIGSMPKDSGPFNFGVSVFPPLYADALYARDEDLDRIFKVEHQPDKVEKDDFTGITHEGDVPHTIEIGSSAVFKNYPVKAQIDSLFGGHIAVLGNTGSGKSCTVASIIQSVLSRDAQFSALGSSFIFFDVNGEYRQALDSFPWNVETSYLKASTTDISDEDLSEGFISCTLAKQFLLPHWFMTVDEWALLLRASDKSQLPALRTALGMTTLFSVNENENNAEQVAEIQNHVIAKILLAILQSDASSTSKSDRILSVLAGFNTDDINLNEVREFIKVSFGQMEDAEGLAEALSKFVQDEPVLPSYANKPFSFEKLQAALDLALHYEEANGNRQIRDYCSQLVTRLKSVTDNPDFFFLKVSIEDLDNDYVDQARFVDRMLGITKGNDGYKKERQICVIDLNDASDEIVELSSAVIARLIFDRMRRADPRNRMPVHIVLEEAHRYISERPSRFAIDASSTFQRIAKEGRKYGAFLLVASQRPSELSKTVLSQCNNFIIHRIQNPDDLSQIKQMTPFISETVLKRLPSLPKQHALIFGSAVNIPTTFRVRDAAPTPNSDDTQIRDLWYVPKDPKLNWKN